MKKIIWLSFLVASILFLGIQMYILTFSWYEFVLSGLLLFFSLSVMHSFIFVREMHLGGFILKPEGSKELRIFFLLGAIAFWFISLGPLLFQKIS